MSQVGVVVVYSHELIENYISSVVENNVLFLLMNISICLSCTSGEYCWNFAFGSALPCCTVVTGNLLFPKYPVATHHDI